MTKSVKTCLGCSHALNTNDNEVTCGKNSIKPFIVKKEFNCEYFHTTTKKRKYSLKSWKVEVRGEFFTDDEAIHALADQYMSISKCDPPGEHPMELMSGSSGNVNQDNTKKAKMVFLFKTMPIFGIDQSVQKYALNIHPFKPEHWWNVMAKKDIGLPELPYEFQERPLRYEVIIP